MITKNRNNSKMEKLKKHKKIITDLLNKYSTYTDKNEPHVQTNLFIDEQKNAFLLITMGWHDYDYTHFVDFHLELKSDGKIWIHENRTDVMVEDELVEQGVDRADIVLGLVLPPEGLCLEGKTSAALEVG